MSEKRRPWDDVDTLTVDYVRRRIQAARQRLPEDLRPLMAALETTILDRKRSIDKVWDLSGVPEAKKNDFTEALGLPFVSFRRELRLDAAKMLFESTRLTVKKVSERVGYRSHAALTNAFTKHFGISPSDYQLLMIEASAEIGEGALNLHRSAAKLHKDGDIDRACDRLVLAWKCYREAGPHLPDEIKNERDELPLSWDIRNSLLSEFCANCQALLESKKGARLLWHLSNALIPIPIDLEWLNESCDDCYRKVWDAINRARIGMVNDAWIAWWLCKSAGPASRKTVTSRAHYINAIAESRQLASGDQAERMDYVEAALDYATRIADPILEAQARIWRGSTLVPMGEHIKAWKDFKAAENGSRASPWLSALLSEQIGLMFLYKGDHTKALHHFKAARRKFSAIDRHLEGRSLIHHMEIAFNIEEYEEALDIAHEAYTLLDTRRDPLTTTFYLRIDVGITLAMLGRFSDARAEIAKCYFDRSKYPKETATEIFTYACIELLEGNAMEAVPLLNEAKRCFETLTRPVEVALAASYLVEAHTQLRNRTDAIDNTLSAFKFFEQAGRKADTLKALMDLRLLLSDESVDALAVINSIRAIAKNEGGWLPASCDGTPSQRFNLPE